MTGSLIALAHLALAVLAWCLIWMEVLGWAACLDGGFKWVRA